MFGNYKKVLFKKYSTFLFVIIIIEFEITLTSSAEEQNLKPQVSFIVTKHVKDYWPKRDLQSIKIEESSLRTNESKQSNFLKTLEKSMITPTAANDGTLLYPITTRDIQEKNRKARIEEMHSQNGDIDVLKPSEGDATQTKLNKFSVVKGEIERTSMEKDNIIKNLERLRNKFVTSSDDHSAMGKNLPAQDIIQELVENKDTNENNTNKIIDGNSFTTRQSKDVRFDINKNSQSQTRNTNDITSRQAKNLDDLENESGANKKAESHQSTFLKCGTNYSLDLTFNNVETWELECTLVLSRKVEILVTIEGLEDKKISLEFSSSRDEYTSKRVEDNMTPVCIPLKKSQSVCLHFGNSYIRQPKYVSLHPYLILDDNQDKRFDLGALDLILGSHHEHGHKQSHPSLDTKHHYGSKIHDYTQAIQSGNFETNDLQPNTQYWNSNGYHDNIEISGYHGNHAHSYHSSNANHDHGHYGNDAHYGIDSLHSNTVNHNPEYYDASSYEHGYSDPHKSFDSKSYKSENEGWKPVSNFHPH